MLTTKWGRQTRPTSPSRGRYRPELERLEVRLAPATFTVINTADSGAGSLRQAILDANATLNVPDQINFNILGAGVQTIAPASTLPPITDPVSIDGGNGGDATNRVQISGGGTLGTGLSVSVSSDPTLVSAVQIRNLVINGFTQQEINVVFGSGHVIQGNFLGLDPTGTAAVANSATAINIGVVASVQIGGTTAAERNVITASGGNGGIFSDRSAATIEGNFIGLNAAGTAKLGDVGLGVLVSDGSATIGGTTAGAGNVIVGSEGILFTANQGQSSGTVQGNFIGTDVTGTVALNLGGKSGIEVDHSTRVKIIGNVISGNGDGINIDARSAASSIITVQGNFIGTAADGVTPLGNTRNGVSIFFCSNNKVGGTGSGEGNVIAFNGGFGVQIGTDAGVVGNAVQGNSIFGNGRLGIDLAGGTQDGAGVTTNDPGDADTGSNNLQNFPVITSVTSAGGSTTITGTLNSTPNTTFTIEFFANNAADPSSFGEGQIFLGAITTGLTDTNGDVSFTATLPVTVGPGQFVTATATDPAGNTSEFSQVFPGPSLSIGNVAVTEGNAGTVNADFVVTLSIPSSQTITVDFATADGTATAANNDYVPASGTVTFGPGVTSQVITILVNGDTTVEPDETFTVNLSNAQNAKIGTATGTGTIRDDDTAPTLTINSVSQNEGNSGTTAFLFTVTLSAATGLTVTVDFATADGTATAANNDYQPASGTLTFDPNSTTRTITVLVNGDTTVEPDETFTVNLSNPQNAIISTGTGTGTILNDDAVSLAATTTVVASSSPTSVFGQTVTFTATVSSASPGTPTGTVTFMDGTSTLGSGTLAVVSGQDQATFSPSTPLSVGSHSITAVYGGDGSFAGSTSAAITQTVNKAATTTAVGASASNTVFGQPVTFTATVAPSSPGTPTPTGSVNFVDSTTGQGLGSVALNNGSASLAGVVLGAGSHTIVASYQGDGSYLGSQGSTSETVQPATLTVTANNASRVYGSANPAFTDTITGFVNGDNVSVVSGSASLTTAATASSPVGTFAITAAQGTLSAANYTFTFVNGTLTVTPAVLTVTANNASRVFGTDNPTFTDTISGFVNGDSPSVVSGSASLTTPATTASPVGTYPITAAQGTLSAANYTFTFVNGTLTVTPSSTQQAAIMVTGADAGGGPDVRVYEALTGKVVTSFFAFDQRFTGGVRVAVGDVNGDGIPDIICGAGPGGGPNVRVYDGQTMAPMSGPLGSFFPFDAHFTGGVFVAAGDLNGDGFADIIVGADSGGGPNVAIFSGKDGSPLASFFPYDMRFTGGVRVAAGDVDGDGRAEIITGSGLGGGPNVTVYRFINSQTEVLQSYFAFDPHFSAGIYVSAGDVNGDGKADVVVGAGSGGGPNVAVFNGVDGSEMLSYFPYDIHFTGGVRVAATDRNGDGRGDVLSVPGGGGGPDVRTADGITGQQIDEFFAYDIRFTGGLFVATNGR